MYKSNDNENISRTMQDKKSGIYQDRTAGKLPQGRVAQHYQDMDAKMEQVSGTEMLNDLKAAGKFVAGGGPFKDMYNSGKAFYKHNIKPGVDKLVDAKNKTFGPNFFEKNVVGDIKSSISGVKEALKKD